MIAYINKLIRSRWADAGVVGSPAATDAEWCRRVYLDVIGRIPTAAETMRFVSDRSRELLRDLDVLVLDGLRQRPHPTHFCIPEAVEVIQDLRPRNAYLTHLTHTVDHVEMNASLPSGIECASDGLTIEL